MSSPAQDPLGGKALSVGDEKSGYPCPTDGTRLRLLEGGAWCPECHTVWRQLAETALEDTPMPSRRETVTSGPAQEPLG